MAATVRFGLMRSNRGVLLGLTTPDELLAMGEMADATPVFEHIWVGDQIMAKPRMESIVLMAGMAARTQRVKIGVACMASFPSRHPVVLAYQWASLDLLSHGRMILGACIGVPESSNLARVEQVNMGITNAERAPRLEGHNAKLWIISPNHRKSQYSSPAFWNTAYRLSQRVTCGDLLCNLLALRITA
jgi:hypothetical protein